MYLQHASIFWTPSNFSYELGFSSLEIFLLICNAAAACWIAAVNRFIAWKWREIKLNWGNQVFVSPNIYYSSQFLERFFSSEQWTGKLRIKKSMCSGSHSCHSHSVHCLGSFFLIRFVFPIADFHLILIRRLRDLLGIVLQPVRRIRCNRLWKSNNDD